MKMSSLTTPWIACALLLSGACTRSLTIDDGTGTAGNDDSQAGASAAIGGQSGQGHAGDDGAAGQSAGTGEAGSGEAGAAGDDGAGEGGATAGSGGAAGGDGDGWGGSLADAPTATTMWTGNAASCPSSVPQNGSICDVGSETCAYHYTEGNNGHYSECACRETCGATTETHWDCYRNGGGDSAQCPATQPENGTSCFGLKGVNCDYPVYVTCQCPRDEGDDDWRCVYDGPPTAQHPDVVNEDVIVSEMTAEQRAAWCEWYAPDVKPGFPEPPVLEPNADGFYPDTGCGGGEMQGCTLVVPGALPAPACEDNLALSTCEATVRDLTDCILTWRNRVPSPHGCARYLNSAGCSGTLLYGGAVGTVPAWEGPSDSNACLVRVR